MVPAASMPVLVAVLLGLGLLPLALRFARGRGAVRGAGVFGVWAAVVAGLARATATAPAPPLVPEDGRPREVVAETFVSSRACLPCHPHEYDTWRSSYHRTMTQLATPDVVRGAFDGRTVRGDFEAHRMERRGDAFYVDGERVVMTTGSHHMQAYWVSDRVGRSVSLVQAIYVFEDQRWIRRRDAFLQPPLGERRVDHWNTKCIECHATHGRPRLAQGIDTEFNELGIACEACHGPAQEHVARNRSPVRRYVEHFGDGGDPTIVNPRRLSSRLASHVCARCHANQVHATPELDAEYFNGEGDPHRPGDDIERTAVLIPGPNDPPGLYEPDPEVQAFRRDSLAWPDGPARGSGREFSSMLYSPCFGTGNDPGDISCLSCHRMHRDATDPRPLAAWADDQLGRDMDGDAGCLQCHETGAGSSLAAHTHHAPESSGSRCYNCHMPHTTYGLLKAIRSHQVSSPSVATDLATGRPNACNLCHLDRSLGWTAQHLSTWYGTPAPTLTAEQQQLSAAVRGMLTGEARLRVLYAWHAGWAPAQRASGNDWIAPFVAPLLADRYAVVRTVAGRSIRTLPGFDQFVLDDTADPQRLAVTAQRAWGVWGARGTVRRDPALLTERGGLDGPAVTRLLSLRDDPPVGVVE
jgi:Cytochrome c554 and c-prime